MLTLLNIFLAMIGKCDFVYASNGTAVAASVDQNDPPAASAKPGSPPGAEVLGPGLGHYILLDGGEFVMGSKAAVDEDERHEHEVSLRPFYVGRTPVTNAQFVRFLNEDHVSSKEYVSGRLPANRRSISEKDGVWNCDPDLADDACGCETWKLADRYCRWLSQLTGKACRLPTEAEWEFACRGKEGRRYPWGNKADRIWQRTWQWRGWDSRKPGKVAVGSFPEGATPEGVCDLVGYMDECCSDWYSAEYYAQSPKDNPQGPLEPTLRNGKVRRGGLEHPYEGFFHNSQYFGVLPSGYLPTGWSRQDLGRATSPRGPSEVDGRLGFRVVVELDSE